MNKLEAIDAVHHIQSPVGNEALTNNGYAYGLLEFDNTIVDYFPIVNEIRDVLGNEKGISITGEPVISKDINEASQMDLIKAEAIGLPIALIVLLLAFWHNCSIHFTTDYRWRNGCDGTRYFNFAW